MMYHAILIGRKRKEVRPYNKVGKWVFGPLQCDLKVRKGNDRGTKRKKWPTKVRGGI